MEGFTKALLLSTLCVCGYGFGEETQRRGGGGEVSVYNWADYIGEQTLDHFSAEFNVRVNYDVYDTAPLVDAKLMTGKSGYDVVVHAAANAARLMPAGVFLPLDKSRLPNWRHYNPDLLAKFGDFDPGNRYGVPYMWGTTGFSYNQEMILSRLPSAPVASSALVFDPEVIKHFADCGVSLLDSAPIVIGMAMLYLGYPANSIDPQHLYEVELLLGSIRPHIKYFSSTRLLNDLPSEELCIGMSWSGDYSVANRRATDAGVDMTLAYSVPQEGSLIWFDVAYVPADAPNVDNAYLFLDYISRPGVIADISNFTGYANANRSADKLVDAEIAQDPAIYPTPDILARLYPSQALPPKQERLRSRLWTRVKAGLAGK